MHCLDCRYTIYIKHLYNFFILPKQENNYCCKVNIVKQCIFRLPVYA